MFKIMKIAVPAILVADVDAVRMDEGKQLDEWSAHERQEEASTANPFRVGVDSLDEPDTPPGVANMHPESRIGGEDAIVD